MTTLSSEAKDLQPLPFLPSGTMIKPLLLLLASTIILHNQEVAVLVGTPLGNEAGETIPGLFLED
jgi:hypothetical protein